MPAGHDGRSTDGLIGTIAVRGIQFEAHHGAYAGERAKRRLFEVDVELAGLDLTAAARSDRLGDAANYEDVCAIVVRVGTERTHHLLESLCAEIVAAIGARFPDVTVTCELRKPMPPCEGRPAYAAVRLTRGPRRRDD